MDKINKLVKIIRESASPVDAVFIDDASRKSVCVFYFRGRSIRNKTDFFNTAKKVMRLPDYFGDNWDAFEECINDLSWLPAEGYIFVYDNTSVFFSKHPDDADTLLSILNDIHENRKHGDIPFEVVLASDKELFK